MEASDHTHIVLEFMANCGMRIGDGVPIDAVLQYGFHRGFSADELETALVEASARGWIKAIESAVHLTKGGYAVMNPANDNFREP